ncbi:MAG: hypothetical protein KF812_01465 [Fimbriimonadaceae bacterium]|nr:hypothetical protein [Fimbriimonadaceae bacterium]
MVEVGWRILLIGIACVAVSGCANRNAEVAQSGTELPTQGENEGMGSALEGLKLTSNGIELIRPAGRADRGKANLAFENAERAITVENTPAKAAGFYRDAILADPQFAPAYEGLARAMIVKGDPEAVESALTTAIRLDPRCERAHFLRGTVAQMRSDYGGALKAWRVLADLNPDYPDLYARMAIAAHFDGDHSAALTYLGEADRRKQNVPSQFRELLLVEGARP